MDQTEKTNQTEQPANERKREKKKFLERRSAWYLIAAALILVFLAIGILAGGARTINDRIALAESQAESKVKSQIDGARLDIEEGRYEVALDRLDWILDEMADFLTEEELAEIGELYSQSLVLINSRTTATPQPSPMPTQVVFTPTPDLRGVQELFENTLQLYASGQWDEVIRSLQALRENDLHFRAIEVDGLLYGALRNRGIQKILVENSLEPGIYDLTLAERFAPLDSSAEGLRTWTRLYITGASYWDVDWYEVVFYFEQVYPHLPNLMDGTFMTATERFRIGVIEYAKQLFEAGEYCLAQEYLEKALMISEDADARTLSEDAAEACLLGELPHEEGRNGESTPAPIEEPTAVSTEKTTPETTETPDG